MEKFETRGVWWLPQQPENQVAGFLKFDPVDGAVLEVIGDGIEQTIIELNSTPIIEGSNIRGIIGLSSKIDLICGFTKEGDAVSLCNCHKAHLTWSTGYSGYTYKVSIVFWGNLFEKSEDIIFDSMSVNYSYLVDWIASSGLDGKAKQDNFGRILEFDTAYRRPAPYRVKIDNFSLVVHFELQLPTFERNEIHAVQKAYIEIIPDQPLHYSDFQKTILRPLRDFICLGIGRALTIISLRGENKDHLLELPNGEVRKRDTVIFFSSDGAQNPITKIENFDMLFTFMQIKDHIGQYLAIWFSKKEALQPVLDLYVSLLYLPTIYSHLAFLSVAQALEIYHRRLYADDGLYMSPDRFDVVKTHLIGAIPDSVEKQHKESIKFRLEFFNELSLKRRMELILEDNLKPYSKVVEKVIDDKKKFINKFVATRNYYTHYSESSKKQAILQTQALNQFTQQSILILQLCFLLELGIPADIVEAFTKNARGFRDFQ